MNKKPIVSPSPHFFGNDSTPKIMRDVIIALIPALLVSIAVYGWNSLVVTLTAIVSCVLFEYLIQRYLLKRDTSVKDCSAIVTGMLLAFNVPSTLPLWMVVTGALVAIGIGKMSFGGLGSNPFNPALVGRVFLLISFPSAMTSFEPVRAYHADAFSGATPLSFVKEAIKQGRPLSEVMPDFSYMDLFMGSRSGSLGEIAALALIAGFLYLLVRKVITWHVPVYVLGSMFLFSGMLWLADPDRFLNPVFQILTGGALLGAIYMATDYATSPMNKKGMLIYGIGIGVITILIRAFGSFPEGISFAILIMNAVVPLLNKYTKPRRFGKVVVKK